MFRVGNQSQGTQLKHGSLRLTFPAATKPRWSLVVARRTREMGRDGEEKRELSWYRATTFHCLERHKKKKNNKQKPHSLKLQYRWEEESAKVKRKDLTKKRGKAEAKPRNVFSKSRQRFGEGKKGHNRDHVHTFQAPLNQNKPAWPRPFPVT